MIIWTFGIVSINHGTRLIWGLKRYIEGWERAARKHGLYFGVSLHADHAWSWYETSQRHDTQGPKKVFRMMGN